MYSCEHLFGGGDSKDHSEAVLGHGGGKLRERQFICFRSTLVRKAMWFFKSFFGVVTRIEIEDKSFNGDTSSEVGRRDFPSSAVWETCNLCTLPIPYLNYNALAVRSRRQCNVNTPNTSCKHSAFFCLHRIARYKTTMRSGCSAFLKLVQAFFFPTTNGLKIAPHWIAYVLHRNAVRFLCDS